MDEIIISRQESVVEQPQVFWAPGISQLVRQRTLQQCPRPSQQHDLTDYDPPAPCSRKSCFVDEWTPARFSIVGEAEGHLASNWGHETYGAHQQELIVGLRKGDVVSVEGALGMPSPLEVFEVDKGC